MPTVFHDHDPESIEAIFIRGDVQGTALVRIQSPLLPALAMIKSPPELDFLYRQAVLDFVFKMESPQDGAVQLASQVALCPLVSQLSPAVVLV